MLARKPSAVIPKRLVKGGYDDATTVFTPGRWERMPVGPPEKWWHELPLKWPDLMPEWGAKVKQTIYEDWGAKIKETFCEVVHLKLCV